MTSVQTEASNELKAIGGEEGKMPESISAPAVSLKRIISL